MKDTGADIFKVSVVPNNMLLIHNQIPIKRIVQKSGSLVYIESGMLMWKESLGNSIHSTWEILPITQTHLSKVVLLNQIDT